MTRQQLNLLAMAGLAACWGAFGLAWLAWLAGAIYYESRSPAERTRSWFGTAASVGAVIATGVSIAVPRPAGAR